MMAGKSKGAKASKTSKMPMHKMPGRKMPMKDSEMKKMMGKGMK